MAPTCMRRIILIAALVSVCGCKRKQVVASFPDSFVGVGLELKLDGAMPVVVRAIPGGSAAQAGVEAGDRLTMIDGVATSGLSLGDVVVRLRGQPNSQVTLTLDRRGQKIVAAMRRAKMTKGAGDYQAPAPPAGG